MEKSYDEMKISLQYAIRRSTSKIKEILIKEAVSLQMNLNIQDEEEAARVEFIIREYIDQYKVCLKKKEEIIEI